MGRGDESWRRSEAEHSGDFPSTRDGGRAPDKMRGLEPSLKLRLWRGVSCPLYVLAKHNRIM